MRIPAVILGLVAVTVSACSAAPTPSAGAASPSAASPTASPRPTLTPTPTASPTATAPPTRRPTATPEPSGDGGTGSVVVTFRTAGDEEFRIRLIERDDIAMARRLLSGKEQGLFPNGLVVRGGDGGVNVGWSWHIDPASVEFAQFSMEVCDGRPSYVENGTHTGGDRFCPWTAVVVAIESAG